MANCPFAGLCYDAHSRDIFSWLVGLLFELWEETIEPKGD